MTLLHPEGEPLTPEDAGRPLLLIDSSWRDLPRVLGHIEGELHYRALPVELKTAYPRRSSLFQDPENGLASVEALYAASCLLGEPLDGLLSDYRWREEFLARNESVLSRS